MSLLDDIKSKADANGDGKIDQHDLESLRSSDNNQIIDQLKEKADQNNDGRLDLEDLKNLDFGNLANDAKNAFSDVTGKLFK